MMEQNPKTPDPLVSIATRPFLGSHCRVLLTHTTENEERENISLQPARCVWEPAFTVISLVYPHFSIGDIFFIGTRHRRMCFARRSWSKEFSGITKSYQVAPSPHCRRHAPSAAASLSGNSRDKGGKWVQHLEWNMSLICTTLASSGPIYPSLFLFLRTGRVCHTILYYSFLHMETGKRKMGGGEGTKEGSMFSLPDEWLAITTSLLCYE